MNPVANVLESGTTPPLYNKTKPALKQPTHKLSWTRDADCSRGSRCRAPPGLNPANIRRAGRACQLEAAPGLPLSFLPRGTRLDRSTPSLRCRGEPGAPDRPPPRAAPSAAHSHTACEAKVTGREVWVGDRSLAARPPALSGRRGAIPPAPAPSAPLPGPPELRAGRACSAAAGVRAPGLWRGGLPGRRATGGWGPAGKNGVGDSLPGEGWPTRTPPRPACSGHPARLPSLGWERGPRPPPCGSGVASPARRRARPAGVRSGSRVCHPD